MLSGGIKKEENLWIMWTNLLKTINKVTLTVDKPVNNVHNSVNKNFSLEFH